MASFLQRVRYTEIATRLERVLIQGESLISIARGLRPSATAAVDMAPPPTMAAAFFSSLTAAFSRPTPSLASSSGGNSSSMGSQSAPQMHQQHHQRDTLVGFWIITNYRLLFLKDPWHYVSEEHQHGATPGSADGGSLTIEFAMPLAMIERVEIQRSSFNVGSAIIASAPSTNSTASPRPTAQHHHHHHHHHHHSTPVVSSGTLASSSSSVSPGNNTLSDLTHHILVVARTHAQVVIVVLDTWAQTALLSGPASSPASSLSSNTTTLSASASNSGGSSSALAGASSVTASSIGASASSSSSSSSDTGALQGLLHHISAFAFTSPSRRFAFYHLADPSQYAVNGWRLFHGEFILRFVISRGTGTPLVDDAQYPIESAVGSDDTFVGWRISSANQHYGVCSTYSSVLAVPSSITDTELADAALFRSRARIPILSYIYPLNGAAICRCSQPKAGVTSARSEADEKIVAAISQASQGYLQRLKCLYGSGFTSGANGASSSTSGILARAASPSAASSVSSISPRTSPTSTISSRSVSPLLRAPSLNDDELISIPLTPPIPTTATTATTATATASSGSATSSRLLVSLSNNSTTSPRSSSPRPAVSSTPVPSKGALRDASPLPAISNDSPATAPLSPTKPKYNVYIIDARPRLNALAQKAAGRGWENTSNYAHSNILFLGIANIHVMRESLNAVRRLCTTSSELSYVSPQWMDEIRNTHWLDHIRLLLESGIELVKLTIAGYPLLVHCSDGWDRTAQMVALEMVMLDPFYRTILGFEMLIEQEWLAAGHQFGKRSGLTASGQSIVIGAGDATSDASENQQAPIFHQWLECVYQLLVQFPDAFEFTEEFLVAISYHSMSCRFGTFLFDCQQERMEAGVDRKTASLWSFLNFQPRFLNASYRAPDGSAVSGSAMPAGISSSGLQSRPVISLDPTNPSTISLGNILWPRTGPRDVQFWMRYHVPHAFGVTDPLFEELDGRTGASDHAKQLELLEQQRILLNRTTASTEKRGQLNRTSTASQ